VVAQTVGQLFGPAAVRTLERWKVAFVEEVGSVGFVEEVGSVDEVGSVVVEEVGSVGYVEEVGSVAVQILGCL